MQKPTDNPIFQNADMKQCFDRLPIALQENILQSGIPMYSVDDIRDYAAQYQNRV